MKVGLLNIGSGNIFSISTTLKKLNIKLINISSPEYIDDIDIFIMPGVGAFNTYMNLLNIRNFPDKIYKFAKNKDKKILGICVGMQVLFEIGEENGFIKGLGLLQGKVEKNYMGLNIGYKKLSSISTNLNSPLKKYLNNKRFYFTHGYHVKSELREDLVFYTENLDENYFSFINKDNIFGCQFHPELSGKNGENLLASICNV